MEKNLYGKGDITKAGHCPGLTVIWIIIVNSSTKNTSHFITYIKKHWCIIFNIKKKFKQATKFKIYCSGKKSWLWRLDINTNHPIRQRKGKSNCFALKKTFFAAGNQYNWKQNRRRQLLSREALPLSISNISNIWISLNISKRWRYTSLRQKKYSISISDRI